MPTRKPISAPIWTRCRRPRHEKFLNTLYVLNKDAYLSLEGENIVLLCNKAEIGRVPLHTLEGIVCFSYPGASLPDG